MISRLFQKKKPAAAPVAAPRTPATPEGQVVWAIGDIHGRLDLLEPLVEAIIADAAASAPDRTMVIFLGDYIDRGPDSRGVIRLLSALPREGDISYRFLKGNHEETMVRFLNEPSVGRQWCEYGGEETLRSYQLKPPTLRHSNDAWRSVSADLRHALDAEEIAFLENLELSIVAGDYFFAHAGANPEKALDRQSAHDLMWIRRSFLDSTVTFDKLVVHGHTPTAVVHADQRRIGIDTRAYDSGILTALRLEGRARMIMQAVGPSDLGAGDAEVCIKMIDMPVATDVLEIGV